MKGGLVLGFISVGFLLEIVEKEVDYFASNTGDDAEDEACWERYRKALPHVRAALKSLRRKK